MTEAAATIIVPPPEPIHNCPQCSHWLAHGTLVCPDCATITYAHHLRRLAVIAQQQENEKQWPVARSTWASMLEWLPKGTSQYEGIQGHIAAIDNRTQAQAKRKADWTRRLGPLAPVLLFLAKAKTVLFAILKFKFLFSFVGFFGVYWLLFGWRFGLGFAVSILIHEMGHYLEARRLGLKVELPVFLPGFGAYVRWYNQGVSLNTLSSIALSGPAAGLMAASTCAIVFIAKGGRVGLQEVDGAYFSGASSMTLIWGALAHAGAWVNLINLVPVLGLDGAQATYALNRVQRGLVLTTTILFYAFLREGVFLFIAAGMAWRLFTGPAPEQPSSPTMIRYMLLLFALGTIMWVVPNIGRQF